MPSSLLRDPDDKELPVYEIDHVEPGPIAGWTSGYFWWEWYGTPGYVTAVVGAAGDICFPLYCRWADGEYRQMFVMRYDRAREVVEMLTTPLDFGKWGVEGEPESTVGIHVSDDEFQPDVLFSELTESYCTVKLLEPVQAEFLGSEWDGSPAPNQVWRPVDTGQDPETVLLVSDEETGLGDLIAEEREKRTP